MLCCTTVIVYYSGGVRSRARLHANKFMSAALCFIHCIGLILSAVFDFSINTDIFMFFFGFRRMGRFKHIVFPLLQ